MNDRQTGTRERGGGQGTAPQAATVSTDAGFRQRLESALWEGGTDLELALHIDTPFQNIGDEELERLRSLQPDVIFMDLDTDADVGLRFAEFLVDSGMARAVVGACTDISADLLLAAMRAGVLEFIPKPPDAESVSDAIQRVWKKTGALGGATEAVGAGPGDLITVFSAKGGSGSTALSVNLAIEIHRLTRKKTALIDLDLELGETALLLGVEPRFSIVDLLRNFHRVDSDLLASYIEQHESGVELLSAPYQPVDFESVSGDRIRKVLEFLRRQYDYIVVDAPKTFNPTTLGTFEDTDQLYLVTIADLPSLRNVARSLPLLRNLGEGKPEGWMRLIVNRYDSGAAITLEDVESTVGIPVYWTLANDYQSVMESINEGKPVVLANPGSQYAQDVATLASEITGIPLSEEKKGGLLGSIARLFGGDGGGAQGRPGAVRESAD